LIVHRGSHAFVLSLFAGACASSNHSDASVPADAEARDAIPQYDGGRGDAVEFDALPCVPSLPPTHLVEDFCRTADGAIDFSGSCLEENPTNEY
jgi:hypothetical protein